MLNYIVTLSNGFLMASLIAEIILIFAMVIQVMTWSLDKKKPNKWLLGLSIALFLIFFLFLTFFPNYDQWQILLKGGG